MPCADHCSDDVSSKTKFSSDFWLIMYSPWLGAVLLRMAWAGVGWRGVGDVAAAVGCARQPAGRGPTCGRRTGFPQSRSPPGEDRRRLQ